MAYKYGQMEQCIRDTGKMEKHLAKVNLHMSMEMSMMDSGQMIKPVVEESIFITMAPATKENGQMITNTAMEFRNGLTVVVIRVCISKVKNMDKENMFGETAAFITETGSKTKLQVLANMCGLMDEDILEIGSIIRCMEVDSTVGGMAVVMTVSTNSIKNMVLVHTHGLTVVSTQGSG